MRSVTFDINDYKETRSSESAFTATGFMYCWFYGNAICESQ